jgi:hypothetical protein
MTKDNIPNLPKEAWMQLVDVSTKTFIKLVYPLTATTEGVGKLIEQKFNKLESANKVIAAECIKRAQEKVDKSGIKQENIVIKPIIFSEAFKNTDQQSDPRMLEVWSNALAREITEGSVHPEIAKIIGKLTAEDISILFSTLENNSTFGMSFIKSISRVNTDEALEKNGSFNYIYLSEIGLIESRANQWFCTTKGKALAKSINRLNNC